VGAKITATLPVYSAGTTTSNIGAATHCNTLQHYLQHTATHCNTLQLQHIATHCNTTCAQAGINYEQYRRCNTLQHIATHCNTTCAQGGINYEQYRRRWHLLVIEHDLQAHTEDEI